MRELTYEERTEVSGGFDFVDSVASGSALGATGYGGLALAAGYSMEVVTASFAAGGAIGGIGGAFFYGGYLIGTALGAGTLGSELGKELAEVTSN